MAKVGDKIRIIQMDGQPEYGGRTGVVERIDDMGLIYGDWGKYALIPAIDRFELLEGTV